ncbi:ATP-binding cassette domain-containing protein [Candidatus Woesearchaeota archaeon]|nr:ATP-binding cassette domain-containing protein [Candidatus Woesearchaeota archaeon]
MKKAIIQVRDLKKDYYQYKVFVRGKLLTRALRGVSFDVYPGDFIGLIGVNGAGKSTLMRTLTTNMQKSSGKVSILGYDIEKDQEAIKDNISWMFGQDYSGIGWASLEKNMHLAAAFMGLSKQEAETRITQLLKKFHLDEKKEEDVWRLSTGMSAKYSLAVALLKNPKILFLDEPLLGLDTYAKDEIRLILKELNEKGTTIIYTDHQLQEVEKICKRLLIINQGKLLFDGSVKRLKQVYRDTNVLDVVCTGKNVNKAMLALLKNKLFTDYEIIESEGETHTLRIYTSTDSKKMILPLATALQKNKLSLDQINAGLLSLEDVYRKFLRVDSHDQKTRKLEAFEKAGEDPLEEFEKLLAHTNPRVRARACHIFWKKNKAKVQPILLNMLSGTKDMQQEALRVIGQVKDKTFSAHVLSLVDQKEILTKNHAIIALAKIGDISIVEKLLKLFLDPDTVTFALEHLTEFDATVVSLLQEEIQHLSGYDKEFIRHYCLLLKKPKHTLELLHLEHKDYRHWKQERQKREFK